MTKNKYHGTVHTIKLFLAVAVLFVLALFVGTWYRSSYLRNYTAESLGTLAKYVKGGEIRDYRNTINAKSIDDLSYEYDSIFQVYKIYFGDYTIYLDNNESSWSPESLKQELEKIGITFKREDEQVIFYFIGEEIGVKNWQK